MQFSIFPIKCGIFTKTVTFFLSPHSNSAPQKRSLSTKRAQSSVSGSTAGLSLSARTGDTQIMRAGPMASRRCSSGRIQNTWDLKNHQKQSLWKKSLHAFTLQKPHLVAETSIGGTLRGKNTGAHRDRSKHGRTKGKTTIQ